MSRFAKSRLKAPFPYFGGKSAITDLVWRRFGNVTNYIEPFFGSGAMLLGRPEPRSGVETVNDINAYVVNFWRATSAAPEDVVTHADWPVNETDMYSRHKWLTSPPAGELLAQVEADPDFFDARLAGWWVWGMCCWIGAGWCANASRRKELGLSPAGIGAQPGLNSECGIRKRPAIGHSSPNGGIRYGAGVHAGRPQLGDAYDVGRGVNGNGEASTCDDRLAWLLEWFSRLRDRLRLVRVCCGHWSRVCDSPSTTTRLGMTGIFLDPPYRIKLKSGKKSRDGGIYPTDKKPCVVDDVIGFCQDHGSDPLMRIAVCGYEGEGYEALEAAGWTVEHWKAQGGYGNNSKTGKVNATRERIWFSPACIRGASLFD